MSSATDREVSAIEFDPALRHRGRARRAWRLLREWPVVSIIILTTLVSAAVFAPLLANQNPERGDLTNRNIPPFWESEGSFDHILGTDQLGRDIWSRLVFGARISLIIAGIVLSTGAVGGTVLGLVSGYAGGWVDEVLMRFVDLSFAMPFILVALVVVIVVGQSFTIIVILLIVFSWGGFARQTRARRCY